MSKRFIDLTPYNLTQRNFICKRLHVTSIHNDRPVRILAFDDDILLPYSSSAEEDTQLFREDVITALLSCEYKQFTIPVESSLGDL